MSKKRTALEYLALKKGKFHFDYSDISSHTHVWKGDVKRYRDYSESMDSYSSIGNRPIRHRNRMKRILEQ